MCKTYRKGTKMKKIILICLSVLLLSCGCSSGKAEETVSQNDVEKIDVVIEYDAIQNLFLSLTPDTTIEDIEKYVDDYSLFLNIIPYNGSKEDSYKIAFEEDVTKKSHAKAGDYIEINFSQVNNEFMNATYVLLDNNQKKALYYVDGVYDCFREADRMDGNYVGYYLFDLLDFEDSGMKIKYSNGKEGSSSMFRYNTGEELLNDIILMSREKKK